MKIDPLRVTTAVGPNLRSRIGLTGEWIVGRDRAVVVETQNLAGNRIELLGEFAIGRIAGRYVKLAIWSKPQTAPRVKLRGGNTSR